MNAKKPGAAVDIIIENAIPHRPQPNRGDGDFFLNQQNTSSVITWELPCIMLISKIFLKKKKKYLVVSGKKVTLQPEIDNRL